MKCAKCGHEAGESKAQERAEEKGKAKRKPFPIKKKGK